MKEAEFSADGKKLKGSLFFPKNLKATNPAILFIHGWTSERKRSYQYANGLAKIGYVSFLFDMRGHGESEGDINTATTKEFFDDVLAAYDYLLGVKEVDKENISAVGSSFGGYFAALLTGKRSIRRVVLRAPADYPNEDFNKSKMQSSGDEDPVVYEWRTQPREPGETLALSAIANFTGEVFIIESEKDDIVPHQTIQNYANAVKDKSKLTHKVIKAAPHSIKDGPFKDEIEKALVGWFESKL